MTERHDIVVIGGGQAGLAMSYCLSELGREHVVLERGQVAERWNTERWDSLAFQFPNWSLRLPGYEYRGDDPEEFAGYREIATVIENYALEIDAPVHCGTEVTSLSEGPSSRFLVQTSKGNIDASQVVIATGPFQSPSMPACAADLPARIFQVHASRYRNPDQLPPGAVLVVGTGGSGVQIAEELLDHGRRTYVAVGRHRRVPRRYRSKDFTWWFVNIGWADTLVDSFPERKYPPPSLITGVKGGHDLDVRVMARDGAILVGRLLGIAGEKLAFAEDTEQLVEYADNAYWDFRKAADAHILAAGIDLPEESAERPTPPRIPPIAALDLRHENISSVIWCSGYQYDYDWVKLPVLGPRNVPMQQRGITPCPKVYFLGLHWMHTFKSGVLFGVGDDAEYLARCIGSQA